MGINKGGKMRKLCLLILIVLCQLGYASVFLNTARIAYYNERDFERAKKACLEGIEKGELNFELHAILGGCEIGFGNWKDASNALIRAFAIDSLKTIKWIGDRGGGEQYYFQAFYFAARELFDEEKYEEALNNLGYAKLLNPGDIGTYILTGAIQYKLGNIEQANREYKKALNIDPENPDVHFLIGKSLFETKEFDGSLTFFGDATKYYKLKYSRISKIVFQNLQVIEKTLAQKIIKLWIEQKIDELDQLIKVELELDGGLNAQQKNIEQFFKATDDLSRGYYFTGMAYYYLKKDSIALNNLLKSLELKPDDVDALYFAGEMHIKLKKYDDAIRYFEKVTLFKSDDIFAWFYLGICYTQLKEYKKAIDIYENKVLQLNPENIDAMTNLAYIYSEIGNSEKALEYLRKVEQLQ